jgi:hypothetical protein
VRDYCGGKCSKSNISRKAYKFGFVTKQSYDRMQQNKMYKSNEAQQAVEQNVNDSKVNFDNMTSQIRKDTINHFKTQQGKLYKTPDEMKNALNRTHNIYKYILK